MAAWVDTLMSQAVASNNVETKMAREYIGTQMQAQQQELVVDKARGIDEIAQLLAKATADKMPPAVLNAYEKLLAQVTS